MLATYPSIEMPKGSRICLASEPTATRVGGLAGRGALEHVADVVEVVFQHAGEVRMAGTRPRDRIRLAAVGGIDRHPLLPVFEVAILDDEA